VQVKLSCRTPHVYCDRQKIVDADTEIVSVAGTITHPLCANAVTLDSSGHLNVLIACLRLNGQINLSVCLSSIVQQYYCCFVFYVPVYFFWCHLSF